MSSPSPSPPPRTTNLYALGSNGSGQLGLLHKDDVSRPERCHFTSLAADGSTTATTSITRTDYVPLNPGETVQKLVAGGNHTLLLTTHGRVFGAGSSTAFHGAVGDDDSDLGFREIDRSEFADAGRGTTMDTASAVRRYAARRSEREDDHDEARRKRVRERDEFVVTDVAATWAASFFVVGARRVYCCGVGEKGELGRGEAREFLAFEPLFWLVFDVGEVEGQDGRIERVSACMNHIVILTSSGKLYGWGSGRKGQLGGNLQKQQVVDEPMEFVASGVDSRIRHLVTGRDFTFVMGEAGNDHAVLGAAPRGGFDFPINFEDLIQNNDLQPPQPEHAYDRFKFYALWGGIILKLWDGDRYGFGRNEYGQLGKDLLVGSLESVAVGSEHCVALNKDGTVYAWGWGEHGNCGRPEDSDNPNGPERRLFRCGANQNTVNVGAGCATTFFWVDE